MAQCLSCAAGITEDNAGESLRFSGYFPGTPFYSVKVFTGRSFPSHQSRCELKRISHAGLGALESSIRIPRGSEGMVWVS